MTIERELGEINANVKNIISLLEKQNGRVGKLEEKVENLRMWRSAVLGGSFVISTIAGFISQFIR